MLVNICSIPKPTIQTTYDISLPLLLLSSPPGCLKEMWSISCGFSHVDCRVSTL